MMQYRQGDVLIESATIPAGVKLKPVRGRVVLAHGEATGHAHTIERAQRVKRHDNEDGSFFLSMPAPVEVTHQEHSTIKLPAGDYVVKRQREYSPQEIRRVAD